MQQWSLYSLCLSVSYKCTILALQVSYISGFGVGIKCKVCVSAFVYIIHSLSVLVCLTGIANQILVSVYCKTLHSTSVWSCVPSIFLQTHYSELESGEFGVVGRGVWSVGMENSEVAVKSLMMAPQRRNTEL